MRGFRSFTAVVLGALALGLALSAQATPQVGTPAPDFTGVDTEGVSHKLSDYRGSTVVLEWTNHECPFVQKHYGTGNMQGLQKDAQSQDIVWLSIISSAPGKQGHVSPDQAKQLTQERDAAPSAVLLDADGKIGQAYQARTTPHMFIIDPEGTLAYMGAIDDKPTARWKDVETANNYVRTALAAMGNGQAVESASTRPYGCSVKY
jgi:peroxiredoxin